VSSATAGAPGMGLPECARRSLTPGHPVADPTDHHRKRGDDWRGGRIGGSGVGGDWWTRGSVSDHRRNHQRSRSRHDPFGLCRGGKSLRSSANLANAEKLIPTRTPDFLHSHRFFSKSRQHRQRFGV
jgi:hypothetical protein